MKRMPERSEEEQGDRRRMPGKLEAVAKDGDEVMESDGR